MPVKRGLYVAHGRSLALDLLHGAFDGDVFDHCRNDLKTEGDQPHHEDADQKEADQTESALAPDRTPTRWVNTCTTRHFFQHFQRSAVAGYRKPPMRLILPKFIQMKKARPTMFSSGTNPQKRESSLLSRLSPIMK